MYHGYECIKSSLFLPRSRKSDRPAPKQLNLGHGGELPRHVLSQDHYRLSHMELQAKSTTEPPSDV
jgi:hypothetical protein